MSKQSFSKSLHEGMTKHMGKIEKGEEEGENPIGKKRGKKTPRRKPYKENEGDEAD